jgi:predicted component of type VI protein secretion system
MATKSQLVMRSGPNPGKTFSLNKPEMYIGRDISNDIVINDAEVSRKHVRLITQGERYVIEDLGSTNGTFINGQRIAGPHVLSSGESVQMGENVVVVYEMTDYDPDSTAVMTPREAFDFATEEKAMMPEPEPAPSMTMADEPMPMPEPMAAPAPPPPPMPMPEPMAEPMPMSRAPEPSATYTGQPMQSRGAPPMHGEHPPEAVPEKKKSRKTLIAGCGCLLILLCIAVGAGEYYIDANNLWCSFPFIPGC